MRIPALVLVICLSAAAAETVKEREQPAVVYALGDVHGDYDRLIRLLRAADLIDDAKRWTAGDSVLVVTGDMIDKGPSPVEVLRLLASLKNSARVSGGEVILLKGNHEAEFFAGPDPKKAAEFLDELRRDGIKVADVIACRGEMGELLCSLPIAARVGDWFFSHAGNTAGCTIPQLAQGMDLLAPDSILEARLARPNPWFYSGTETEQALISRYANALGVKHMVQGHQHGEVAFNDGVRRLPGEMFQHWGLLFLIDVGMSREIDDSEGALLEIRRDQAAAICPDGSHTLLWSAQLGQATGRAKACSSQF